MYQPPPPATAGAAAALYNPYLAAHYASAAASLPHYFPAFPPPPPPRPSPVPEATAPPDLTSITPAVAARALRRLVIAELRAAGFDAAQTDALRHIQVRLAAFLDQLFARAHDYANLANRAPVIPTDLLRACADLGIGPAVLHTAARRPNKHDMHVSVPALLPAPPRSPEPHLLPSDDEGAPPAVPPTLRLLPAYFPSLPPKHTYLRTPPSPPKKAALPSLEKKLKTAALVQESLRNLLVATEDSTNQEESELLGHIVNCESSAHPRKRWNHSHR